MDKHTLHFSVLVILTASGLCVSAAETKEKAETPKVSSATVSSPTAAEGADSVREGDEADFSRRGRSPAEMVRRTRQVDPEQRFLEQISLQSKEHIELINELTEIKKLAEEEGAEKTAEAIQKLIDKRNEEHRRQVQEMHRRRLDLQKRIQERMKTRQERAIGGVEAAREKRAARRGQTDSDKQEK